MIIERYRLKTMNSISRLLFNSRENKKLLLLIIAHNKKAQKNSFKKRMSPQKDKVELKGKSRISSILQRI